MYKVNPLGNSPLLYMYICFYIYVYIYICIYVYMYIYICMYKCCKLLPISGRVLNIIINRAM